ncbi:MAG TPA: hypothetical protein VIV34_11395 [Pseudolabrys sp.]
MRKFVFGSALAGLLVAVAFMAMPVNTSSAVYCEGECIPAPAPKKPQPAPRETHNVGPIAVGCGISAAAAEMIGAAAHAGDKNDPRQSTIFEAGWYAAACPVFLPWSLMVTATCPDNKATYEIARQAHRYGLTHQSADWTPFTTAYGESCRNGKLSRDFLAFLKANHLKLSAAYRRG